MDEQPGYLPEKRIHMTKPEQVHHWFKQRTGRDARVEEAEFYSFVWEEERLELAREGKIPENHMIPPTGKQLRKMETWVRDFKKGRDLRHQQPQQPPNQQTNPRPPPPVVQQNQAPEVRQPQRPVGPQGAHQLNEAQLLQMLQLQNMHQQILLQQHQQGPPGVQGPANPQNVAPPPPTMQQRMLHQQMMQQQQQRMLQQQQQQGPPRPPGAPGPSQPQNGVPPAQIVREQPPPDQQAQMPLPRPQGAQGPSQPQQNETPIIQRMEQGLMHSLQMMGQRMPQQQQQQGPPGLPAAQGPPPPPQNEAPPPKVVRPKPAPQQRRQPDENRQMTPLETEFYATIREAERQEYINRKYIPEDLRIAPSTRELGNMECWLREQTKRIKMPPPNGHQGVQQLPTGQQNPAQPFQMGQQRPQMPQMQLPSGLQPQQRPQIPMPHPQHPMFHPQLLQQQMLQQQMLQQQLIQQQLILQQQQPVVPWFQQTPAERKQMANQQRKIQTMMTGNVHALQAAIQPQQQLQRPPGLPEEGVPQEQQKLQELHRLLDQHRLQDMQKVHQHLMIQEQQRMQEQQRIVQEQQRAQEQLRIQEQLRLQEQERILQEQQRAQEQQKIQEQQRVQEQERILQEQQRAQEQQKIQEQQRVQEQERILQEQQRAQEQQKIQEQQRVQEQQRILQEQQRAQEQQRIQEQQKLQEVQKLQTQKKAQEQQRAPGGQKAPEQRRNLDQVINQIRQRKAKPQTAAAQPAQKPQNAMPQIPLTHPQLAQAVHLQMLIEQQKQQPPGRKGPPQWSQQQLMQLEMLQQQKAQNGVPFAQVLQEQLMRKQKLQQYQQPPPGPPQKWKPPTLMTPQQMKMKQQQMKKERMQKQMKEQQKLQQQQQQQQRPPGVQGPSHPQNGAPPPSTMQQRMMNQQLMQQQMTQKMQQQKNQQQQKKARNPDANGQNETPNPLQPLAGAPNPEQMPAGGRGRGRARAPRAPRVPHGGRKNAQNPPPKPDRSRSPHDRAAEKQRKNEELKRIKQEKLRVLSEKTLEKMRKTMGANDIRLSIAELEFERGLPLSCLKKTAPAPVVAPQQYSEEMKPIIEKARALYTKSVFISATPDPNKRKISSKTLVKAFGNGLRGIKSTTRYKLVELHNSMARIAKEKKLGEFRLVRAIPYVSDEELFQRIKDVGKVIAPGQNVDEVFASNLPTVAEQDEEEKQMEQEDGEENRQSPDANVPTEQSEPLHLLAEMAANAGQSPNDVAVENDEMVATRSSSSLNDAREDEPVDRLATPVPSREHTPFNPYSPTKQSTLDDVESGTSERNPIREMTPFDIESLRGPIATPKPVERPVPVPREEYVVVSIFDQARINFSSTFETSGSIDEVPEAENFEECSDSPAGPVLHERSVDSDRSGKSNKRVGDMTMKDPMEEQLSFKRMKLDESDSMEEQSPPAEESVVTAEDQSAHQEESSTSAAAAAAAINAPPPMHQNLETEAIDHDLDTEVVEDAPEVSPPVQTIVEKKREIITQFRNTMRGISKEKQKEYTTLVVEMLNGVTGGDLKGLQTINDLIQRMDRGWKIGESKPL